KIIYGSIH
ncbi:histone H3.2, partial [Trichinella spiralis]